MELKSGYSLRSDFYLFKSQVYQNGIPSNVFFLLITFLIFALRFRQKNQLVMYAIVNIAGKQFKVTKDQYVYAPKLDGDAGASVEFDQVLLAEAEGTVSVGAPLLAGAKVSGKILDHVKGDKVIVFKKKRRKGYKKKNGHRQDFTKVLIETITL